MTRTSALLALILSAPLAGCGLTDEAAWNDRIGRDGTAFRTFDATAWEVAEAVTSATDGAVEIDSDEVDLDVIDGTKLVPLTPTIPTGRDPKGWPVTEWTLKAEDLPAIFRLGLTGKDREGREIKVLLEPAADGKVTLATVRIIPANDPASARSILDRTAESLERIRREKSTPKPAGPG